MNPSTSLAQVCFYLVLSVPVVIVAYLLFRAIYEHFFPEAKAKRERINAQITESERLYDEEMARQERSSLPVDEALELANAEVNIWRRTTGGL